MDYIERLTKDYKNIDELVIKNINNITIIYIESLVNQNRINEYILKNIVSKKSIKNIKSIIPAPNVKDINNYKDLLNYLNNGFTIIISNDVIAVETKEILNSSIKESNMESSIIGPKDALTENIQTNLGLIKRRIKNYDLKNKNYLIGKYTNTQVDILYINSIIKKDLLNKVLKYFKNINIDGITGISELKDHINKDNRNVFPSIKLTERPDTIVNALLNGKIVILMDTAPFALIIPSFFIDFINPIDDNYIKNININFIKIIRFLCFIISIITPAFYVAITTFNQETVPTELLINFQTQRIGVPFPALFECLITLIICEILRESDIRFPSNYGSSISVLGALVLGEAAVSAGIVSPIMIIIVAITYISSLIFTDLELINALRTWRFIFLLLASFYGLYGICISILLLIIYLSSYEIMNIPYIYPFSPFDLSYIKETFIKMKNNKRSKILSNNINKGEL